jgi:hypothetical protein
MGLIELHKRRLSNKPKWYHILTTVSNNNTWCFHRFRLYTASSNTLLEARKPDGTVISRQLFRTPGYAWGGGFEMSAYFDLSSNIAKEPIQIWITGIGTSTFQQLYAVNAHAGSAVRYSGEDPNITGMTNAELRYVNMGVLKFDYDFSTSFVYIENQGLTKIDGGQSFRAKTLDISGNALPSSDIDDCMIGCDLSGGFTGNYKYSGGTNGLPTIASRAAYDALISKGWTITGTPPPTS